MSLREQLLMQSDLVADTPAAGQPSPVSQDTKPARQAYQQLKMTIHQTVIERVELDKLQRLSPDQVKRKLAQLVERIVDEDKVPMNEIERKRLVQDVQDEMLGLGPLEPLLNDPTVSDILVNTSQHVYVERRGKLGLTDVTFYDDAHLMKVIERIVSRVGRRIDESTPMVDARLPDGSRVNAIIPPSAIDGPLVSIRRFAVNPLTVDDMLNNRSFTPAMAQLLESAAADRTRCPATTGRTRQGDRKTSVTARGRHKGAGHEYVVYRLRRAAVYCDGAGDRRLVPVVARQARQGGQTPEGACTADAAHRGEWWKIFGDPVLDNLEQQAADANQDLKAAAARVQQSRALKRTSVHARVRAAEPNRSTSYDAVACARHKVCVGTFASGCRSCLCATNLPLQA
jgi:Type II/IV secretion system protein